MMKEIEKLILGFSPDELYHFHNYLRQAGSLPYECPECGYPLKAHACCLLAMGRAAGEREIFRRIMEENRRN